MTPSVTASIIVEAAPAAAFDAAAGIEPSTLIKRTGLLPAIIDTQPARTPWRAVGDVRRHKLSDGGGVVETLIAFDAGRAFAYALSDFTGPMNWLARGARAEWTFTPENAAQTRIEWRYAFIPRGPVAALGLYAIAKGLWPRYLQDALYRVKQAAEDLSHPRHQEQRI